MIAGQIGSRCKPCIRSLFVLTLFAVNLLASSARTQGGPDRPGEVASDAPPLENPVLLVITEPAPAAPFDAERLITQIRLTMDRYTVKHLVLGTESADKWSGGLDEPSARMSLAAYRAAVACWIERDTVHEELILHLVTKDRVLQRDIQLSGERLEADLAWILREQLRTLMEMPIQTKEAAASPKPPASGASSPSPSAPPSGESGGEAAPRRRSSALGLSYLMQGEIWGGIGPITQLGFGVTGAWRPIPSIWLGLSAAPAFRSGSLSDDIDLFWRSVQLGVSIGYLGHFGAFAFGPEVSALFLVSRITFQPATGEEVSKGWMNFLCTLGPTFEWSFTPRWAIALSGTVGLSPKAAKIRNNANDHRVLFAAPLVTWHLFLGGLLFF